MSYDVGLQIDAGNGMKMIGENYNYTSNMYDFFEWALGENLKYYNEIDAWLFGEVLERAIHKIRIEPREKLLRFNSDNGWGDVIGASLFLANIAIECAKYPNAKVSVSA
jgi:hypothetical protein